MIVGVLFILLTTVYVQAQKGEILVRDYLGFIEQIMKDKQAEAVVNISEQRHQSADAGKNQLREFYLDKLFETKGNVEQHKEDYLIQLEETKKTLKEKDLKEFEQQKANELRNETEQDVEEYFEELLSEK